MINYFLHTEKDLVGDTIRLIHAIDILNVDQNIKAGSKVYLRKSELDKLESMFLACKPQKRKFGLFSRIFYVENIQFIGLPDLFFCRHRNRMIIILLFLQFYNFFRIRKLWHVYIPEALDFRERKMCALITQRIDKGKFMKRKNWRFQSAFKVKPKPTRILYFIRDNKNEKWRNSVPELLYDIQNTLKNFSNIELAYVGLATEKEYFRYLDTTDIHCLPYFGYDYQQQIDLISEYDLAIGVNCAGLDLASIAGLPVIRLCEFQAMANSWGPDYNSFLSVRPNIGLVPKVANEGWYDSDTSRVFKSILTILLQNWDHDFMNKPYHILIQASTTLPFSNIKELEEKIHVDYA
jgi:hypothetical protein